MDTAVASVLRFDGDLRQTSRRFASKGQPLLGRGTLPVSRVHVLGISGSLRRRSYNTAALRAAGELMPDDMELEIADLGGVPMFNEDDESIGGFPDSVMVLRDQVANADALLIATPEYNYSLSGALKNAIDWLSRPPNPPINLKPAAVLGAGGRLGTARAQKHFRDVAVHNDLRLVQQPEVLIASPWDKFDDDLALTDDRTRDQIRRLIMALRGLTSRIKMTRRRVLIVGHPSYDAGVLASRLRETGYEPVVVVDHDSALSLIDPGRFSALIVCSDSEQELRSLRGYVAHIAPDTVVIQAPDAAEVGQSLERLLGE